MKLLLVGHPSSNRNSNTSRHECSDFDFSASGGYVVNLQDPQTGEHRNYLYIPGTLGVEGSERDGGKRPKADDQTSMAQDLTSKTYALQQQTLTSGNIYEIQKLHNSSHHGSTANKFYGSYFVDSTVISDGNLYLCSMVDPLYFILPFVSNTTKWMPLDQVVSTFSVPVQNSLCTYQLKNLMDFKQLGDEEGDLLLCRYNESKAVMWLKTKFLNCSDGIHKKMQQVTQLRVPATEDRNQIGAFAPGFVMDSDVSSGANKNSTASSNNNSEELEVRDSANRYALQLLCEYLNELWRTKVMNALGFPDDYLLIHPKSANSDADILPVITPTHENNDKKRKPVEPAKTYGQKKLAKVDTKGMKSLCSFFSSSSAKKKKYN
jgi:hypothetical protein